MQETKNSHLFDKSCSQKNVKCHMNKVDLDEFGIEQVNYK